MRQYSSRSFSLACLVSVLVLTGPLNLYSQSGQPSGRLTPITAALVDQLPSLGQNYSAIIMRSAGPSGRDVILMPRATANGELLDAAVRALLHARVKQGDRPTAYKGRSFRTIMIGVRTTQAAPNWVQQKGPLAQKVVDRLFGASKKDIQGIGAVPAIDFYPPRISSAQ